MANILTKSAFQPIFGNPEPDVPAHAGIVRSRRGCRGQGSHAPYSKLKLSAKSQYLFYRTATDSKNFVSLISYQVQVIGIPVRQKADFTHGQSFCGIPCVGRPPFVTETLAEGTAGSQKAARPLRARTAGSCAGLSSPRPLLSQTSSFFRKGAPVVPKRFRECIGNPIYTTTNELYSLPSLLISSTIWRSLAFEGFLKPLM